MAIKKKKAPYKPAILHWEQVEDIFNKFASPLIKRNIDRLEEEISLATSMLLLMRLASGTDTEENIHNDLTSESEYDYDFKLLAESLYFSKMKPMINNLEIQKLRKYFFSPECLTEFETYCDQYVSWIAKIEYPTSIISSGIVDCD
jgi:hypothetical protein